MSDDATMARFQLHMLELVCKIPPYVYEYADERGNLFHVVKKARPEDDIPNTVLVRRRFNHMEEKVIYYDVMGNNYDVGTLLLSPYCRNWEEGSTIFNIFEIIPEEFHQALNT